MGVDIVFKNYSIKTVIFKELDVLSLDLSAWNVIYLIVLLGQLGKGLVFAFKILEKNDIDYPDFWINWILMFYDEIV